MFHVEVTDLSTKAYKMLIAMLLDQTSTAGYHNEQVNKTNTLYYFQFFSGHLLVSWNEG